MKLFDELVPAHMYLSSDKKVVPTGNLLKLIKYIVCHTAHFILLFPRIFNVLVIILFRNIGVV